MKEKRKRAKAVAVVLIIHENPGAANSCHHSEILDHKALPYSNDLAPHDYHALRGLSFENDDEIKEAAHSWLREQGGGI